MGSILEAFAEGELHVIPSNEIQGSKHQKLFDKIYERQEKLEKN